MKKLPSMPRSCGLTLRTFRTRSKFELDAFTDALRPHTKRFKPRKTKFSNDTITKAEHSQQTLYWLLDAYAKWSGYPVGFIYLFGRISCELRDGNITIATRIASSLRALAAFVDEHASIEKVQGLQPNIFNDGVLVRPEDGLDAIAYDTIIRYQQVLPLDHRENRDRMAGNEIKYTESQQIIDDARQVRVLLEMLAAVPPPLAPSAGDEATAEVRHSD